MLLFFALCIAAIVVAPSPASLNGNFSSSDLVQLFSTASASFERPARLAFLADALCNATKSDLRGNHFCSANSSEHCRRNCELSVQRLYAQQHLSQPEYAVYTSPERTGAGPDFVALMLTGQVRGFLNPLIQQYWRDMIASIRSLGLTVRIFAVLELQSWTASSHVYPLGHPKRSTFATSVHNDTEESVRLALDLLSAGSFEAHFLNGQVRCSDHASLITSPQLRSLITYPSMNQSPPINIGYACNQYSKLLVAYDMLVAWETSSGTIVLHVLRLRPDLISFPMASAGWLQRAFKIHDAVFVCNDVFAIMPRPLAGSYFTTVETHMFLYNDDYKNSATSTVARDILENNLFHIGTLQPTTHLARHGVLFAGSGIEMLTHNIPYAVHGVDIAIKCLTLTREITDEETNSRSLCVGAAEPGCSPFPPTCYDDVSGMVHLSPEQYT